MRFSLLLSPLCVVLASVAYPQSVHSASSRPASVHPAGPPISGAPAGVTAFVDVSVVPMDRERVLSHQTVLVEGGRITTLGPASHIHVPAGAARIDGRGHFLLPGLADMHAHLYQLNMFLFSEEADSAEVQGRLLLWLANGVTTIRNMDYALEEYGRQALRWRARAAAGHEWIPRIYTAGKWGPTDYINAGADGRPIADGVAAYVGAYKAAGYDFLKVHEEKPDILDSVLAAAKQVGIPVAGHVPPPSRVEHILSGYTSMEHVLTTYLWNKRDEQNSPDTTGIGVLAAAMRRAGVWHCPTQMVFDRYSRFRFDGSWKWDFDAPKILKVEQDSGVKLLVGTDDFPWLGVIARELQAFVAGGLTPYQALVADTRNVAEYFGTLEESGTIAVGKRADMILLTGDPLQDVRYTAQPAGVMLGGRWLSRTEIDRRVKGLTLPTDTPESPDAMTKEPVKSYWHNVVDEAAELSMTVSHSTHVSPVHTAQRKELIDSLGVSDQYRAGTQRVLHLIAQQLGEDRLALTPEACATFDLEARAWVRRRKAEGYIVAIPGVTP